MVEHDLVEAYFESNGFLVHSAGNSAFTQTKRKYDPLTSIAVMNPRVNHNSLDSGVRLFSGDLQRIRTGIVAILGWTNSSFSPAVMSNDTRQVKFLKQQLSKEQLDDCFNPNFPIWEGGASSFLKLLVVPSLPANNDKMKEAVEFIRSLGVEGVLTLRSILENLFRQTSPNLNKDLPSVFKIFGLIKAYGLAKDPQMEIFKEAG